MRDEMEIQKLLRLKRYEQPSPDYYERFIEEFHRRQQTEILRQSVWKIALERFTNLLSGFRVPTYAYGAAFGVFAVATAVMTQMTPLQPTQPVTVQVAMQPEQVSSQKTHLALNSVPDLTDLNIDQQLASRPRQQAIAPRYVLDARPVSYEGALSF